MWQEALNEQQLRQSYRWLSARDSLGLLSVLEEDGFFGAWTTTVGGRLVSRDLLDSVNEIYFLTENFGANLDAITTVLDIGAGYGRLALRLAAAFAHTTVLATDAIPISTAICENYFAFAGAERARVVPLHEVSALPVGSVELATAMHSLNEIPLTSIEWWLRTIQRLGVRHLFVVPNDTLWLTSTEPGGEHLSFEPLLAEIGYTMTAARAKYAGASNLQLHGTFPETYVLFSSDQ